MSQRQFSQRPNGRSQIGSTSSSSSLDDDDWVKLTSGPAHSSPAPTSTSTPTVPTSTQNATISLDQRRQSPGRPGQTMHTPTVGGIPATLNLSLHSSMPSLAMTTDSTVPVHRAPPPLSVSPRTISPVLVGHPEKTASSSAKPYLSRSNANSSSAESSDFEVLSSPELDSTFPAHSLPVSDTIESPSLPPTGITPSLSSTPGTNITSKSSWDNVRQSLLDVPPQYPLPASPASSETSKSIHSSVSLGTESIVVIDDTRTVETAPKGVVSSEAIPLVTDDNLAIPITTAVPNTTHTTGGQLVPVHNPSQPKVIAKVGNNNGKMRSSPIQTLARTSWRFISGSPLKHTLDLMAMTSWHPTYYLTTSNDVLAIHHFEHQHQATHSVPEITEFFTRSNGTQEGLEAALAPRPGTFPRSTIPTQRHRLTYNSAKDPMRVDFLPTLSVEQDSQALNSSGTSEKLETNDYCALSEKEPSENVNLHRRPDYQSSSSVRSNSRGRRETSSTRHNSSSSFSERSTRSNTNNQASSNFRKLWHTFYRQARSFSSRDDTFTLGAGNYDEYSGTSVMTNVRCGQYGAHSEDSDWSFGWWHYQPAIGQHGNNGGLTSIWPYEIE